MNGLDIYMRSTDKDGLVTHTQHRCWDVNIFMDAQQKAVAKVGGKSSVKRITREEYLAAIPKRSAS